MLRRSPSRWGRRNHRLLRGVRDTNVRLSLRAEGQRALGLCSGELRTAPWNEYVPKGKNEASWAIQFRSFCSFLLARRPERTRFLPTLKLPRTLVTYKIHTLDSMRMTTSWFETFLFCNFYFICSFFFRYLCCLLFSLSLSRFPAHPMRSVSFLLLGCSYAIATKRESMSSDIIFWRYFVPKAGHLLFPWFSPFGEKRQFSLFTNRPCFSRVLFFFNSPKKTANGPPAFVVAQHPICPAARSTEKMRMMIIGGDFGNVYLVILHFWTGLKLWKNVFKNGIFLCSHQNHRENDIFGL